MLVAAPCTPGMAVASAATWGTVRAAGGRGEGTNPEVQPCPGLLQAHFYSIPLLLLFQCLLPQLSFPDHSTLQSGVLC